MAQNEIQDLADLTAEVNGIKDSIIVDSSDLDLVTETGCIVDAKAIKDKFDERKDFIVEQGDG